MSRAIKSRFSNKFRCGKRKSCYILRVRPDWDLRDAEVAKMGAFAGSKKHLVDYKGIANEGVKVGLMPSGLFQSRQPGDVGKPNHGTCRCPNRVSAYLFEKTPRSLHQHPFPQMPGIFLVGAISLLAAVDFWLI